MKKYFTFAAILCLMTSCSSTTKFEVEMEGKISDMPWQHMIGDFEDYPHSDYFDSGDGDQLVIYSKMPIECEGRLKIYGSFTEVEGASKKPGSEEVYREKQVLVDKYQCQ